MSLRHTLFALTALATSTALVGCNNDKLPDPSAGPVVPMKTGDAVALSASGKVITFNRADLTKLVSSQPISGLMADERFIGIDVRPQDGMIYGVTTKGNIYTLDDSTGKATLKLPLKAGAATDRTCTGGAPAAFTALSGTEFALDFNPQADRLRVVSDTRQDLRINVADGAVIVDCPITFATGTATPKPTGAAYRNSIVGMTAMSTELYYIDSNDNTLYEIDTTNGKNANNGVLVAVGPLGVDIGDVNGFDIEGRTGTGYMVATVGGTTTLYTVDVDAGTSTARINFAAGESLRGISLK